jgi:hypothetical protein
MDLNLLPGTSTDTDYSGLNAADISVTNRDDDTAGITVIPTSGLVTTEAGGTASFTVVLDAQPSANVTIPVSSSNTAEGTVSPASKEGCRKPPERPPEVLYSRNVP